MAELTTLPTNSINNYLRSLLSSNNSLVYMSDININYNTGDYNIIVVNEDAITNHLINLLYTPIGSREFEPTFGSNLFRYLQQPITDSNAEFMRLTVLDAIKNWLPIITIHNDSTLFIADKDLPGYIAQLSYYNLVMRTNSSTAIVIYRNS